MQTKVKVVFLNSSISRAIAISLSLCLLLQNNVYAYPEKSGKNLAVESLFNNPALKPDFFDKAYIKLLLGTVSKLEGKSLVVVAAELKKIRDELAESTGMGYFAQEAALADVSNSIEEGQVVIPLNGCAVRVFTPILDKIGKIRFPADKYRVIDEITLSGGKKDREVFCPKIQILIPVGPETAKAATAYPESGIFKKIQRISGMYGQLDFDSEIERGHQTAQGHYYYPSKVEVLRKIAGIFLSGKERARDLGAGDGIAVAIFSLFAEKAGGVELDFSTLKPSLMGTMYEISLAAFEILRKRGLIDSDKVELLPGDFCDEKFDYSEDDMLYLYWPFAHEGKEKEREYDNALEDKLLGSKGLKEGAVFILNSNGYMDGFRHLERVGMDNLSYGLPDEVLAYRLPGNICTAIFKRLEDKGVMTELGGRSLSGFSTDDELFDHLERYAVISDRTAVTDLLRDRISGKKAGVFDSLFNPRKRLADRLIEKNEPLRVVQVRGGRGAAGMTEQLSEMAGAGLVELTIIPGAIDDGRSFSDMAYYLGITGIPDVGKSLVNMATDKEAVGFSEIRLINTSRPYPPDVALKVLEDAVKGFNNPEHVCSYEDSANIAAAFRKMTEEKQKYAAQVMGRFLMIITGETEKGNSLSIGDLPVRSMMIIGSKKGKTAWQSAVDEFGSFVGARGRVVLSTDQRLYGMAFLTDGSFLPGENAINEAPKGAEYLCFELGVRSFADPANVSLILLAARMSSETGAELVANIAQQMDKMRKLEADELVQEELKLLSDKGISDLRVILKLIRDAIGYKNAMPPVRIQGEAVAAFAGADAILYGPSNIESNIVSAVMYQEICKAIAGNRGAMKLLFANTDDKKKIEPPGTTAASIVERLFRYMSDQQPYLVDAADWQSAGDYINAVIGVDGRYQSAGHPYIPFNGEKIEQHGIRAIGMDLEMNALGGGTSEGQYGAKYYRTNAGDSSPAMLVDAALSLTFLKELEFPVPVKSVKGVKKEGAAKNGNVSITQDNLFQNLNGKVILDKDNVEYELETDRGGSSLNIVPLTGKNNSRVIGRITLYPINDGEDIYINDGGVSYEYQGKGIFSGFLRILAKEMGSGNSVVCRVAKKEVVEYLEELYKKNGAGADGMLYNYVPSECPLGYIFDQAGFHSQKVRVTISPGGKIHFDLEASKGKEGSEKQVNKDIVLNRIKNEIFWEDLNMAGMAAEKARTRGKIGLFLDESLGGGKIKEVLKALEALSRSDDPVFREWLDGVVIHAGPISGEELNYLVEKKKISPQDMIIITRDTAAPGLADFEGKAAITKINEQGLAPEAYYPILEVIRFSLARAGEPELGADAAYRLYRNIPNARIMKRSQFLSEHAKKTFKIDLGVPASRELLVDSSIYKEIAAYITSQA